MFRDCFWAVVISSMIWSVSSKTAHGQYRVEVTANRDELLYSGVHAEAPEVLAVQSSSDLGECALAAAGANFAYVQSQGAGRPGSEHAVASVHGAELRLTDNEALAASIPTGETTLDFLVHFDVSAQAQAPDIPGIDETILSFRVSQSGGGVGAGGFLSYFDGSLQSESGQFIGLPPQGATFPAMQPFTIVPQGNGDTLTVRTSIFMQSLSRGSGQSEVSVQLADVPLTRADGVPFETLGISYEFVPPPIEFEGARCGSGSGINFWDIVRLRINPMVFSGGGKIDSASVMLLGSGGRDITRSCG